VTGQVERGAEPHPDRDRRGHPERINRRQRPFEGLVAPVASPSSRREAEPAVSRGVPGVTRIAEIARRPEAPIFGRSSGNRPLNQKPSRSATRAWRRICTGMGSHPARLIAASVQEAALDWQSSNQLRAPVPASGRRGVSERASRRP